MNLKEMVIKNRSYRKFDETKSIPLPHLLDMVDISRFTPSSVNIQPFKFYISNEKQKNDIIFPHTRWARLLKDYPGPVEGERPTAYIIVCNDLKVASNVERFAVDAGIISQTILLAAVEKGYGGIMIKNMDGEDIKTKLNMPNHISPYIVLALGTPDEEIILEEINDGEKTTYYRDENGMHHVPKRKLDDIIIK